jgi:hypothetical protein
VLLPRFDPADSLVYRPSRHTAFRLPRLPFSGVQRVAVDRTGRVWVQLRWGARAAPVSSSADGAGPWSRTEVPLAAGGLPQSLDVLGDRVVVTTAASTRSTPAVDALWTRPVDGPPTAAWHRVETTGVRLSDEEVLVGALPDGRLALSGGNQQMYLQRSDGTFVRLRPPQGLRYSYLESTEDGLYLLGAPDNRLYRSSDGTDWQEVAR